MRHVFRRVGAILASAFCFSGALADNVADCTRCAVADAIAIVLEEEDRPRWLLSLTFDDPDTRFGIAVGLTELATPFERALMDAGIDFESSWMIGLRFEIPL